MICMHFIEKIVPTWMWTQQTQVNDNMHTIGH